MNWMDMCPRELFLCVWLVISDGCDREKKKWNEKLRTTISSLDMMLCCKSVGVCLMGGLYVDGWIEG